MWVAKKDFTQFGKLYRAGQLITEKDLPIENLYGLEANGRVEYQPDVKPTQRSANYPLWEAMYGTGISSDKPDTGV
jgi:hypothetical protein